MGAKRRVVVAVVIKKCKMKVVRKFQRGENGQRK